MRVTYLLDRVNNRDQCKVLDDRCNRGLSCEPYDNWMPCHHTWCSGTSVYLCSCSVRSCSLRSSTLVLPQRLVGEWLRPSDHTLAQSDVNEKAGDFRRLTSSRNWQIVRKWHQTKPAPALKLAATSRLVRAFFGFWRFQSKLRLNYSHISASSLVNKPYPRSETGWKRK